MDATTEKTPLPPGACEECEDTGVTVDAAGEEHACETCGADDAEVLS